MKVISPLDRQAACCENVPTRGRLTPSEFGTCGVFVHGYGIVISLKSGGELEFEGCEDTGPMEAIYVEQAPKHDLFGLRVIHIGGRAFCIENYSCKYR